VLYRLLFSNGNIRFGVHLSTHDMLYVSGMYLAMHESIHRRAYKRAMFIFITWLF
jgi:hypothetical protein